MRQLRCCIQYVSKSERPSSGHRTGKGQSSSQSPRRVVLENVQTVRQLHSSPVLVRSYLKILHARLQHYVNQELPDIQVGFRKGIGIRDQIASVHWIIEKAREFQKKAPTSVSLTTPKPLTLWNIINCGKVLNRWEYKTILPVY